LLEHQVAARSSTGKADHKVLDRLFTRIDGLRDELVALTKALVCIPTVNPPGEFYEDCARLIGERLRSKGFAVEYPRATGEKADSDKYPRINVVGRVEGQGVGPCVHFNSHIDVVEAGRGWSVDPWAGELKEGRIYGRGTCDMKGGLAASMIAVEAILTDGIEFPGAFEISGTADEESGGWAGVGWLAKRGYFAKSHVDHVIIPEPLNQDCVCLGHRGVWWAEVESLGRVAHGSMPSLGVNAIRGMGAFIHKVEQKLYPQLHKRQTAMPVIPEGARHSTLNFNSIHGGQIEPDKDYDGAPSPVVADSCRLILDRRYLIEEDLQTVKDEIVGLLEEVRRELPEFQYRIRDLLEFAPNMIDAHDPVVRALDGAVQGVFGKPARHLVSPGTYDQKHIQRIGHLSSCVAYRAGIPELAHQPDEYVVIDDMIRSAKVMAAASLALKRLISF
jgi:succinyl-diaminopimelate desuccinylase